MPNALILALPLGLAIFVAAVIALSMAPRLGTLTRTIVAMPFVLVAGFCLFGFAASFEPGDFHVVWRVLYATLFVACVTASARLVFAKRSKSD